MGGWTVPAWRRLPGRRRVMVAALGMALAATVGLVGPAGAASVPGRWLPKSYDAPPPPGGEMADQGSPMSSLTVVEGAFGTLPDGTFVGYAAPMGENAQLNVTSTTFPTPAPASLGRYPMPGASGDATIAVSPTDGSVYVGTYYQGHLYRWDPATKEMTDLGSPVAGETYLYGLSTAPDGTIYGGTYPNAHVFSYKPGQGFTDYGSASADGSSKYARSTVYDPVHHAVYVGLQTNPRLMRLDLDTGAWTDVSIPMPGSVSAIIDMDYADGRIFLNAGGNLRVLDTATNTEVPVTDATTGQVTTTYYLAARGVSPARQGSVYFSTVAGGKVVLARYDLATDTVVTTDIVSRRGALVGYGWHTENGHDVLYAWAGNYSGGGFRYDPTTGQVGSMQFAIAPAPSPLENVLPSADGSTIYVDAFLNGNAVRYDTATKTYSPIPRLGQVESWTWLGGKIYAGTYPNGALLEYDPGTNAVRTFASLKDTYRQIRPIEAVPHAGEVYFGTEPDYGEHGGAVAVLDPATGSVDVTRNVVPDQTVAALTFVGGRLLVGSSTEGGTGTEPVPGDGHVVEWDPVTKDVVHDVVPVPGADTVNALVTGGDGDVYGLADGTLFQLDPATFTVRRTVHVGPPSAAGGGELAFHPNGYLYVNTGNGTYVVDPLAFTVTPVTSATLRLQVSADRSIYTLLRPDGFTNYLDLGRYVPAATDCPDPDTRPYVTVSGTVTDVHNRFLTTGCTMQDEFPQAADPPRSYPGTVNAWLDGLVDAGMISETERDHLWAAVKGTP